MRGVTLNDMRSTYAQGAIPRPLTGYEPIMEPSSPTSAWQIPHSIITKQEPMDQEERNDSGISGSYFSSSESDRSENVRYSPPSVSSLMYGQAIGVPKLNSQSKVKQFKCKKCEYVTFSQTAFWEHQKSHLKKDKMLSCMRCPFVTEFKHHFEYHMRNHTGYKPFKCTQCNYACVNKSMLNSHLKSHSEVYQYACSDCRYVTKYMHSLKIHLRKYKHNPAMVRNPDGTPNPLSIIDVYGTRRGSRIRLQEQKTVQEDLPQPKPTAASFPFNPFMLNAPQIPFQQLPFLAGSPAAIPNAFLLQNLETLIKRYEELTRENQNDPKENQENPLPENNYENPPEQSQREDKVLDLSKPTEQALRKNRRKGRPFRVAPEDINHREHEELTHIFNSV